jgi:hypothetical protein
MGSIDTALSVLPAFSSAISALANNFTNPSRTGSETSDTNFHDVMGAVTVNDTQPQSDPTQSGSEGSAYVTTASVSPTVAGTPGSGAFGGPGATAAQIATLQAGPNGSSYGTYIETLNEVDAEQEPGYNQAQFNSYWAALSDGQLASQGGSVLTPAFIAYAGSNPEVVNEELEAAGLSPAFTNLPGATTSTSSASSTSTAEAQPANTPAPTTPTDPVGAQQTPGSNLYSNADGVNESNYPNGAEYTDARGTFVHQVDATPFGNTSWWTLAAPTSAQPSDAVQARSEASGPVTSAAVSSPAVAAPSPSTAVSSASAAAPSPSAAAAVTPSAAGTQGSGIFGGPGATAAQMAILQAGPNGSSYSSYIETLNEVDAEQEPGYNQAEFNSYWAALTSGQLVSQGGSVETPAFIAYAGSDPEVINEELQAAGLAPAFTNLPGTTTSTSSGSVISG